ncbi:hypothetical protein VitviT2T_030275 [Vitis vinifera]|uniref:Uncharacterized protein n=1 Tax=Vitis vinifera TaxID=29760 RepID=A0ABY9DZ56_VITVI|nr:hypothetical protein VitviT2T_030275 [Vitis vinifera]
MLFAIIFSESSSSSSVAVVSDFDAKVFRHNLMRSKDYNQKGFGHKDETLELMNREYTSDIIKTIPLLIILIVRTRLEVVITRRKSLTRGNLSISDSAELHSSLAMKCLASL